MMKIQELIKRVQRVEKLVGEGVRKSHNLLVQSVYRDRTK